MGPRRSALLVSLLLSAVSLACAAPGLALEPAGDGWYWQLPQPQGHLLNSVTMPDAQNAWAVGEGGVILFSGDGGAGWTTQASPGNDPLAAVTFTDAQHGCAVGGWGWDSYYDEAPLATSVIVYTTDAGATWRAASQPSHKALAAVTFVDAQSGWAVGQRGTILRTTDGGATWTRQRSGILRDLKAVLFTDAQHGFAGGSRGAFLRTEDGGLTWAHRSSRDSAFPWLDINSLGMDDAGTLWASFGSRGSGGEFDRLARSADGGRHWRIVNVGWDYGVWDLAVDGARVIGVGPADEGPRGTSRVISSSDGGATWQTRVLGERLVLTNVALGGSAGVCAVGTGAASSADGGLTWAATGIPSAGAGSLDFASATEGWATGFGDLAWYWAGSGGDALRGSVLHTSDGATWQEQLSETGRAFFDVDFADTEAGWAVGSGGAIRRSQDGGESWIAQASGVRANLAQIEAPGTDDAWILGYSLTARRMTPVLLRTTDGGTTWPAVTLPDILIPLAMRCLSDTDAWVAGWGDDGLLVLRTQDGGQHWTSGAIPSATARVLPQAIDFVDAQHGWLLGIELTAVGSSVLLATTDGGQTWSPATSDGAFDGELLTAVDFTDADHGWVAGESISSTDDGGATWTREVAGFGWLAGVAAVDAVHVWAGAEGVGIVSTVDAAGDTAAPTTLSVGDRGWVKRATQIALTARDVGGSGIATTDVQLDGGGWQPYGAPIAFPAPADHSGDGRHLVDYRSTDQAGLVEPIQTCLVRVDTVRPSIRLRPSTVGRDGVMRLRGRIDDASAPYVDQFTIVVSGRNWTSSGSWDGFRWPTNRWRTFRETHSDGMFGQPGRYRVRLYATDPAGNRQIKVGESVLTVMRRPARRDGAGMGLVRRSVAPATGTAPAWLPAELREVAARLAEHQQ